MTKNKSAIKKQVEITEEENLKIMQKCPRYEFCNAPKCPLDYFIDERVKLADEEKCKLAKSIRKEIGKGTALKYQGLTRREWAGMKIWESKSDEEKKEIIEQGRKRFAKLRQNRL